MLSAFFLGLVLVQFQDYFRVPEFLLYKLALIAAMFAAYDFICYFCCVELWVPFLRGIAWANLVYGVLSVLLLVVYQVPLTGLGFAYFAGELLILLALSTVELRFAQRFGRNG
jgi:hypothetical protein